MRTCSIAVQLPMLLSHGSCTYGVPAAYQQTSLVLTGDSQRAELDPDTSSSENHRDITEHTVKLFSL